MSDLLTTVLSFLLLYGYVAIFIIFFISAVIVPIPTSTVLLAVGAFSSQSYFNFFVALVVIVVSNCLGDCTDYFLARKYGIRILELFHVRKRTLLSRLEAFLRRYPGSVVFFTRFAGTTDSLTNFLAGFTGISFGIFLCYDFIGNVVSNGVILYVGYFLDSNWQDFTGFFGITDYLLLGITIIVAISIIIWRKNRNHTVVN